MTPEEAIKSIDEILNTTLNYDESIDYELTSCDFDWLETAKKALEKQIPKKPIDEFSTHAIYDNDGNYLDQLNIFTFKCPACNNILASGEISITDCVEIHYCEHCGQAIDWSENNEIC